MFRRAIWLLVVVGLVAPLAITTPASAATRNVNLSDGQSVTFELKYPGRQMGPERTVGGKHIVDIGAKVRLVVQSAGSTSRIVVREGDPSVNSTVVVGIPAAASPDIRTAANGAITISSKVTASPPPTSPPASGGAGGTSPVDESVGAFPGAEGFGTQTPGGRAGRVIEVTNLNDSGPGSFREAVTASGPRIVVFRVGGTIILKSPVRIRTPYLTIAGQTAPGGGITLRAAPTYKQETLGIETHDVVVRYIRSRPGPSSALSEARRALVIRNDAYNVVVDHSSFSWSTDEAITLIDGARDVTLSWNIVSEPLRNSTHVEGPHSKAISISGKRYNGRTETGNISIHHNLIAHSDDRNPNPAGFGLVDIVNNVIYNYGNRATNISDLQARIPVNYVGNYIKPGPDSPRSRYELLLNPTGSGNNTQLWVSGNIGPNRLKDTDPDYLVVNPRDRQFMVSSRFAASPVTTTSADQAFTDVLNGAGARLIRDAVDTRIINDARNGTGRVIDSPDQVGGWPTLSSGPAPVDTDRDGMPDAWETARGLNPRSDDSRGDRDGDGYTNIEEYINSLVG